MKRPLLLDTDVMVDFLRGFPPAVRYVKANADQIGLSAVTVAELYVGALDSNDVSRLDDLFSVFRVLPVTAELARAAGLRKREFGRTHGIGLADAVVAATAEAQDAELKTFNLRHYPMLKGLKPPYPRT
jgi:predicted nucleic acid-binding protein